MGWFADKAKDLTLGAAGVVDWFTANTPLEDTTWAAEVYAEQEADRLGLAGDDLEGLRERAREANGEVIDRAAKRLPGKVAEAVGGALDEVADTAWWASAGLLVVAGAAVGTVAYVLVKNAPEVIRTVGRAAAV